MAEPTEVRQSGRIEADQSIGFGSRDARILYNRRCCAAGREIGKVGKFSAGFAERSSAAALDLEMAEQRRAVGSLRAP